MNLSNPQKSNFRLRIKINGADKMDDVLNYMLKWNILDLIDIKETEQSNTFDIWVRSAISSHVISVLHDVEVIEADPISSTDENVKVPLLYVHGIPGDEPDENVKEFFKGLAPILFIRHIKKEFFDGLIIETTSVKSAQKIAEKSHNEKYGQYTLTVSIQFQKTVTNCFFINSLTIEYPIEVAQALVSKFGQIKQILRATVSGLPSIIVKMDTIENAKLACGFLNKSTYEGHSINSIFIEENHFDLLCQHFYIN